MLSLIKKPHPQWRPGSRSLAYLPAFLLWSSRRGQSLGNHMQQLITAKPSTAPRLAVLVMKYKRVVIPHHHPPRLCNYVCFTHTSGQTLATAAAVGGTQQTVPRARSLVEARDCRPSCLGAALAPVSWLPPPAAGQSAASGFESVMCCVVPSHSRLVLLASQQHHKTGHVTCLKFACS